MTTKPFDLTLKQLMDKSPQDWLIKKMKQRLENDASAEEDASIWTATYVLMGLRYSRELATKRLVDAENWQELLR